MGNGWRHWPWERMDYDGSHQAKNQTNKKKPTEFQVNIKPMYCGYSLTMLRLLHIKDYTYKEWNKKKMKRIKKRERRGEASSLWVPTRSQWMGAAPFFFILYIYPFRWLNAHQVLKLIFDAMYFGPCLFYLYRNLETIYTAISAILRLLLYIL
jgi:hypothetical protein